MPKNPVRYQQSGHLHFLTFRCYRRQQYFRSAKGRELFEQALETMRLRYVNGRDRVELDGRPERPCRCEHPGLKSETWGTRLGGERMKHGPPANGRVHMKAKRRLWLMSIVLMLFARSSHAGMLFSPNRSASVTDPQSQFFTVNGVRIHYFVQGSGVPVVLIHAWLSSANGNWVRPGTMAQLAKDHQVIAFDLAGYGESDKPYSPSAYGNAWVEQVYQLMNHLHIQKAHIVGYSMGGMVALKFIVLHPDRTLSGLLGGMGFLEEGSEQQKKWAEWSKPQWSGAAQLALTPTQIKSVNVPVEMVIGSRDPTMKNYVGPLLMVRTDWPVVEIPGKGHISAVTSQELKDDIASWLAQH